MQQSYTDDMNLTHDSTTREGAFADVFVNNDTVIKLYKSRNHPTVEDRGKLEDQLRRMAFNSEAEAYRIASSTDELNEVTPEFYGVISIEGVTRDGEDISDRYLLDCALEIEYLSGNEVKYAAVRSEYPEVENKLKDNGIYYTLDMSAFVSEDSITVLDFAVNDEYYEQEQKWVIQGKL